MSRLSLALPLALLFPLALGAAPPEGEELIVEFVRAVGMKEGSWRTSMKLISAEIEAKPGADPAVLAGVKARTESNMGKAEEKDECVGPDSSGPTMPGILLDHECSYSKAEAAGGRWSLISECRDGSSFVAEGTYSPKSVTGRHRVDVTLKGVTVHAMFETASRFNGECRPPEPIVYGPVTVTPR